MTDRVPGMRTREEQRLATVKAYAGLFVVIAAGLGFWLGSATANRDGLTGNDLDDACTLLFETSPDSFDKTSCTDAMLKVWETRPEYRR